MSLVVDTHTHVIASDTTRYPLGPIGGHRSEWSSKRPVDVDGLLAEMEQARVDRAVVVQASTVYGHDNRLVVDAVRAHPSRFIGVFSVDVLAPDAVDQIKHWQDEGLSGLRLFMTGTTMPGQADWLDDPRAFPAWEYAQKAQLPICLQMTMAGLPALRGMLQRFPEISVLLDHLARPDLSDGAPYAAAQPLFDMASFPGVYLKLTNRTLAEAKRGASTPAAFLEKLLASFGPNRVAWGSNFPAAEGTLAALREEAETDTAAVPAAAREALFGGTARQLYPALAAR